MSCRQAFELDLPAFLADPRDARFAAFVDHYPRCLACAAEIRAWTELDEKLHHRPSVPAAMHPDPELLVGFDEAPAGLPESQRSSIETHLAGCSACRDELAALRSFALEGPPLGESVPETSAAPRISWLASMQAGLRGTLWQPAFAYTLLALALLPALYRGLGPGTDAADHSEQPERLISSRAERSPSTAQGLLPPAVPEISTAAVAKAEETVVPTVRAESPLYPAKSGRLRALGYDGAARVAEIAPAAGAIASATEVAQPKPAAIASPQTSAPRGIVRPSLEAGARLLQEAPAFTGQVAKRGKLAPDARFEQGGGLGAMGLAPGGADVASLLLDPDDTRLAPPEALESGLRLRIPLAQPANARRRVEVHIFAPGGEREFVERHTLAAKRASIDSRLPSAWLAPGQYRVRVVEGRETTEFLFAIRAASDD